MRALEVIRSTGNTFSSFRMASKLERPFETIRIGLIRDQTELYSRVEDRVDRMMDAGLLDEVRELAPFRAHNALQTVGYKELLDYLDGKKDLEEAVALIKQNTRRYAKRQMTWFRKNESYEWFHPDQIGEIEGYLQRRMAIS